MSASVDELRATVETLSLSPLGTLPVCLPLFYLKFVKYSEHIIGCVIILSDTA